MKQFNIQELIWVLKGSVEMSGGEFIILTMETNYYSDFTDQVP